MSAYDWLAWKPKPRRRWAWPVCAVRWHRTKPGGYCLCRSVVNIEMFVDLSERGI